MIHTAYISHYLSKDKYKEILLKFPSKVKLTKKDHDPLYSLKFKDELFYYDDYKEYGCYIYLRKNIINSSKTYYTIEIKINPSKVIQSKNNAGKIADDKVSEDFFRIFDMFIDNIDYTIPIKDSRKYSNSLSKRSLGWKVNRIDYAANVITPECKPYIKLFQKADKPQGRAKFTGLTNKSGTEEQREGSFYLISDAVNINFYDKAHQMQNYPLTPEEVKYIKDMLRFEVQCKADKIKVLNQKYDLKMNLFHLLYDKEIASETILNYYDMTIGMGDYYTLNEAKELIRNSNYSTRMKNSLIRTLELVANEKSIWKARQKAIKNSLLSEETFNEHLQLIRKLSINPVTLPKAWNIKRLPNLLDKIKENLNK